jgi:hypothetical protein
MGSLEASPADRNEFANRAGCCWVDASSPAGDQNAGRGCPASVRLQGNETRQSTKQTWLRPRRTSPLWRPTRRTHSTREHIAILVAIGAAVDGNPLVARQVLPLLCGRRILWHPRWRGRGASPALSVSNFEQMFADSRVILSVQSVGRKRGRSLSAVSFFGRDAQALAVSSSESDYIRSRTKQISPLCLRDLSRSNDDETRF